MFNRQNRTLQRQHFDRQQGGTVTTTTSTTDHQARTGKYSVVSTGSTSTSTGARARTNDRVFFDDQDARRQRAQLLAGWHQDACMYYQDTFDRKATPGIKRDLAEALASGMAVDVLQACMDEAQRAPRPSWAYCMAIIRRCQRDGLLTLDAWRRDREEWQRRQMSNPALQYQQRDYRETDFGEDFFFDVVGEYGGVTRETT